MENTAVTVAYGDGIGPEIMDATLLVLREAGAKINIQAVEVGERLYKQGFTAGIAPSGFDTILGSKVFLKAPITTPQGGGYKSLNVTIRKLLGLYSNVRPSKPIHPYVKTFHPNMDLVVVRENEEDLYSGIEYKQTRNSCHSIKLITRTSCEKISRFAFEYAIKNNRKKITCLSKDNIMKFTDGLFHKVFDEIAAEYPEIENEHYIVDIGMARVANRPADFDVIVTENLYGDILSDITAEVSGSVGMAGSANIGDTHAMFEAIHGSAPRLAEKNIANPSGLLNSAIMMMVHIGQPAVAGLIENAWLKTIEDGIHTQDIYREEISAKKVGTAEFAQAIAERLGKKPSKIPESKHKQETVPLQKTTSNKNSARAATSTKISTESSKQLVGVDVYIDSPNDDPKDIADKVNKITNGNLQLQLISSKGLKIWPMSAEFKLKIVGDLWILRFMPKNADKISSHSDIIDLLSVMKDESFDFVKIENLYTFDAELGFSLAQGE